MFSTLRKRARHPIQSITEPFGKAGLTVAILALVLATTGAAFAAAGLNSKQKKEVTKIAKKYAGKPGAPGATGPAGPAGTNGEKGAQGLQGEKGEKGEKGDTGNTGATGKSVTATSILTGEPECEERGGAIVKQEGAASGAEVCTGKEGSPWTAGGTLPSEKTETGYWAFGPSPNESLNRVTFSFTLPLEAAISQSNIHLVEPLQSGAPECPGSDEEPTAAKGQLCLYVDEATGLVNAALVGAVSRKSGALLIFLGTAAEASGAGVWAVTAE